MSGIKYGLISKVDARCLEKTIDLICNEFKSPDDWMINVTEIGIYGGVTGNGIRQYLHSKGREIMLTGIDNKKDNEEILYPYDNLIIGNSNEIYNKLEDESQHLIFFDGGHAYPTVIADWYCYMDKIKRGGFAIFHDTGKHISKKKDWQRMGSEDDEDMYISVRKALNRIGLLNDSFDNWSYRQYETISRFNWQLIFDEADENDPAGGVCVFRKL